MPDFHYISKNIVLLNVEANQITHDHPWSLETFLNVSSFDGYKYFDNKYSGLLFGDNNDYGWEVYALF